MMQNHRQSIRHLWLSLVVLVILISVIPPAMAQEVDTDWAPVPQALLTDAARSTAPVSFLVILDEQPDAAAFLETHDLRRSARETKGAAIYHYLTAFARRSQAPLRAWLDAQKVSYRPFYIVNAVEVSGGADLITALRQRPEVARLAENPRIPFQDPRPTPEDEVSVQAQALSEINAPYGILYTRAPEVWAMGYRGAGVVVASQDTGVDWDHPALKEKYRGWDPTTQSVSHIYNWFDAWGSTGTANCDPDPQVPCDDNGHGTHTVGTILGSEGDAGSSFIVGMAPDAEWIGCRNMRLGAGTPASYTACFEFFLAPYPQGGDPMTDGNPALAPDVINNSWYCPPDEGCDYESLLQVVETVRAAGQMVVGSAGNNGPGCETVRYPISAYADVFSVGAHSSSGGIASFSSRGPVTVDGSGRMKPEITAPGVGVESANNGGGYRSLSGTSMAAPHVAGAVALLWSAVPELKGQIDETEQILMKSATPVLVSDCMANAPPSVPNPVYGYGRLDVESAVSMALMPAAVSAVVTDTAGAAGITAQVAITDSLTGFVYQIEPMNRQANSSVRLYPGEYKLGVVWQDQAREEILHLEAASNLSKTFTLAPDVTLSVIVDRAGEPPILIPLAVNDAGGVLEGEAVDVAVLANDVDSLGKGLTVTDVTQPTRGVASVNPDGATVRYAAPVGVSGWDSFTYSVRDANGKVSTATVVIVIAPIGETDEAPQVIVVDPDVPATATFAGKQATVGVAMPTDFVTTTLTNTDVFFLSYSSVVTPTQQTKTPPGGLQFGNFQFGLTAFLNDEPQHGIQFAQPLTVTIQYDGSSLWDRDLATLELLYWNGTAWSADGIQVISHDIDKTTLVAAISHLSEFAFFTALAPTALDPEDEPFDGHRYYLPQISR